MGARWILLAVAASVVPSAAHAADTWDEARTPNFTVVTNAGAGTARQTASEFEQVRAAYAQVWPRGHLPEGKPTVVLAFKNEATLRRWAPGYFEVKGGIDVVSGSADGADRHYLLLRTAWRPAEREVTPNYNLYRAYVQHLLRGSFPRRLPVWLSTGLSYVLGNIFVTDKEIEVGRPVPWQFAYFNDHARLPLQAIFDARPESSLLQKESERPLFDAQCYVLVHYLLYADRGTHAQPFARFLQLWLEGRTHDQALAEGLGDVRALEGQLPLYARKPILSFARFPAAGQKEDERPASRVLAPAEVAGLLAAVHVAMGRPVEAQAAWREARTADPRSPASYDAEGLLADRDRDTATATQAYARAIELGSTSVHTHYRAAQLAWRPDADAAAWAAIRKHLERAIELHPAHAGAHSYLAEVLAQQGDGAAALAEAQRAVTLEPGESYHRVALGRALHQLGRGDEALQAAELGLLLAESDSERSNAERFKLYLGQVAGYARERAQQEAAAKRASACQSGDAAACAALLPDLDKRCDERQADACNYLGWLFGQGQGVAKDATRSAGYVARACDAGDKRACLEHAWAQARGEGVAKDAAAGRTALDALCSGGFAPACTRLALLYAERPDRASRARARELFTRACEAGEADACSTVRQLR